jgi:hypothetical protein
MKLKSEVAKMVDDISDVTQNYPPAFENMFSGSSLILESLSIANIVTRARPTFKGDSSGNEKLFVVYSDELQANTKNFLAKSTTLMPNIPFLLELMIMVFGNTIYLEANEKYDRISHIKHGSSDIPMS